MAKRWKMKFTIFPSSIQMCRSKDLSSFPVNPVPAIYRLSPVNPEAHHKTPTSPEHQCDNKEIKKLKSKARKSTSSIPYRRSDFLIDSINEEESETLISCLSRFSDDEKVPYSGTLGHNKTENQDLIDMNRRKISSIEKVQRVRFQSSTENRRGTETTVLLKSNSTVSSVTRSGKEKKVKESFVVAKKSTDPFEDFKKSMKEVIAEMEISEAKDLEQLLQRFLALNSRSYHGVIVRAFMEIWQEMFVWNPKLVENHQKDVS